MSYSEDSVGLLKQVLENLRSPEGLDTHPWARSLTVQAAVSQNPAWSSKSPGAQLVLAIAALFRQEMPASPPQHNAKRLDTRWGRFGILAANYFAPLLYRLPYPRSLREAGRRLDQSILLFVYGLPPDRLTEDQVKSYELLGDEIDLAATSTISDWHHDGLQDLADAFLSREESLRLSPVTPSAVGTGHMDDQNPRNTAVEGTPRRVSRKVIYMALAGLVLLMALAGAKAYRTYQAVNAVRRDLGDLDALDVTSLQPAAIDQAGGVLARLHGDLVRVQSEASPFFPLTRRLGWIPVYGGDLKYAEAMLATASDATQAASTTLEAATPIWDAVHQQPDVGAAQLTQMLIDAAPALQTAQSQLQHSLASRQRVDDAQLSPRVRALLTRADVPINMLSQGLSVALSVPTLLGATNTGPKTYLILVQNEDELRATGGLISAVGKVVLGNGKVMDLKFKDSYAVDDMQKPYPTAPWQMQSFMNIPVLVFRDTSWYVDYPTAVRAAEYLYAYTNDYSVDGVISVDQHVLETILSVTGPVYVSDIDTTVTADNVRTVMRTQKVPPAAEQNDPGWQRKHFINPIAAAVLQRLISGQGVSWEQLLRALIGDLDQRHILVQLDDPALSTFVSARGWDGAVRAPAGDFLMVVDTNVGYNKTNAVVNSSLAYDVDLTDTAKPRSSLSVFEQNNAQSLPGPCEELPSGLDKSSQEYWYIIDRCYYDYLRVYAPAGTQLTAATPHPVSRAEMVMLDADVPARVDLLDDHIANVTGFGTLLVVPTQSSLVTSFDFVPPADILQPGEEAGDLLYRLKIQKQPGTVAVPVTVRVHLPHGSRVVSTDADFTQSGDNLLFDLDLRTDIHLQIEFRP